MRAGTMGWATSIVFALTSAGVHATDAPNAPLTEDECRAIWNTAAGRAELSADGAKPYIDEFETVDTNRDRKISNTEFRAGCSAGLVHKLRRSE
jgi:hypothetical protein